jgi:ABC-type polysaccharide/polyol phosphate transport system ATPase subunit
MQKEIVAMAHRTRGAVPEAYAGPASTLSCVPPALDDDLAVRALDVSKTFRLPHRQVNTLKERVVHPTRGQSYERLEALRDVSLEVRRGEFFGIVGRNGSGKSTLMKCLAGIYRVDSGEMWMRGRMAPFIELGVGFNPDLTARDNVILNAIMLGLTPSQARERYDEIIAFAELEQFVDLKLKNYSSGMHVRLAFSVMVHVEPDVLLIDEVLAVGDAAFQQKCYDALNRAHDAGRTILLVTHDMDQVQRFCDRALLLDRGRMVAVGDPATVAARYLQLNFADGPVLEDVEAIMGAGEGDGSAVVLDAWFQDSEGARTTALAQARACGLCMRVRFQEPAQDPVFGFVLSDDHHRHVFAATTEWHGMATGVYAPGDVVDVAISFDNWFAPGRYFASPRVLRPGPGRRAMAHLDESVSVVVTGSRSGGLVDIPHEFHLARRAVAADVGVGERLA